MVNPPGAKPHLVFLPFLGMERAASRGIHGCGWEVHRGVWSPRTHCGSLWPPEGLKQQGPWSSWWYVWLHWWSCCIWESGPVCLWQSSGFQKIFFFNSYLWNSEEDHLLLWGCQPIIWWIKEDRFSALGVISGDLYCNNNWWWVLFTLLCLQFCLVFFWKAFNFVAQLLYPTDHVMGFSV